MVCSIIEPLPLNSLYFGVVEEAQSSLILFLLVCNLCVCALVCVCVCVDSAHVKPLLLMVQLLSLSN